MADPTTGWHLTRRMLQDPIALAVPLHTDLEVLPHSQVIVRPRRMDRVQQLLALVIAIVVLVFAAAAIAERLWGLAVIAGTLAALLGVAMWVAYRRAVMSWSATWHRDRVVVRDGRYGRELPGH